MWSALKGKELANRVNTDLYDVERAVARGMSRIHPPPTLSVVELPDPMQTVPAVLRPAIP
jgi:hypothetical protein